MKDGVYQVGEGMPKPDGVTKVAGNLLLRLLHYGGREHPGEGCS